jgi:hypothetical protein
MTVRAVEGIREIRGMQGRSPADYAPGEIKTVSVKKGQAAVRNLNEPRGRWLSLPAGQGILVELQLSGH